MRNYSKPWFVLDELAAVFKGLCVVLRFDDIDVKPCIPLLGNQIVSVAKSIGLSLSPSGDLGLTAQNLQSLIDFCLESNLVEYDELRETVDNELRQLPPSPFVDYFTGEIKMPLSRS